MLSAHFKGSSCQACWGWCCKKCATCPWVASEQLPLTMAFKPIAGGNCALAAEGLMPQLAGKAMATPDPAVSKRMSLSAGPSLYKSSFDKASTTAIDTPWACNSATRAVTAAPPSATVLKSIKPTLRWHCACSTFTKLASRMGVSGWFFIPLSLSNTSPTNKWPLNTVRWLSGKAGVAMVKGQLSASISASVTGPILPRTSPLYQLSKVEQYLKYIC